VREAKRRLELATPRLLVRRTELERVHAASGVCVLMARAAAAIDYGTAGRLAALVRVLGAMPEVLPAAVFPLAVAEDALAMLAEHAQLFSGVVPLFYDKAKVSGTMRAPLAADPDLVELRHPPTRHVDLVVYNDVVGAGAEKEATRLAIRAIQGWLRTAHSAPTTGPSVLLTGQSAPAPTVEEHAHDEADMLLSEATVGAVDWDALDALGRRPSPAVPGACFLSGDLLVGFVRGRTGDAPGRAISSRTVVNVALRPEGGDEETERLAGAAARLLELMDEEPGSRHLEAVLFDIGALDRGGPDPAFLKQLAHWPVEAEPVHLLTDGAYGFPRFADASLTVSNSPSVALTCLVLGVPAVLVHTCDNALAEHRAFAERYGLDPTALVDASEVTPSRLRAAVNAARTISATAIRDAVEAAAVGRGLLHAALLRSRLTQLQSRYEGALAELRTALEQVGDLQSDYEHAMRILAKVPKPSASVPLDYEWVLDRVRQLAARHLPVGATVAVVSRGDANLMHLGPTRGVHFPQTAEGVYAGHHPSGTDTVIGHLEEVAARGASYLLFPVTSLWWLDYYEGLVDHLTTRGEEVVNDPSCRIFALSHNARLAARRALASSLAHETIAVQQDIAQLEVGVGQVER